MALPAAPAPARQVQVLPPCPKIRRHANVAPLLAVCARRHGVNAVGVASALREYRVQRAPKDVAVHRVIFLSIRCGETLNRTRLGIGDIHNFDEKGGHGGFARLNAVALSERLTPSSRPWTAINITNIDGWAVAGRGGGDILTAAGGGQLDVNDVMAPIETPGVFSLAIERRIQKLGP